MKARVKELRVKIDGLAQLTKDLEPIRNMGFRNNKAYLFENSVEIEKAVDSLYLAKAWLGKILGELGEETPYANDGNRKIIEDIEPTADVAREEDLHDGGWQWGEYQEKSHIEKVDWLREQTKKISDEVSKWYIHTQTPSREFAIARTNVYNYLCEARFWLSFELTRVKKDGE
jgi:hypothetical protein